MALREKERKKGFSSKSKLFESLKVYLENKNRLQPIIGLGTIIECVKSGTRNREALYICEVCMCRLSKADMRNHIIGSFHRYNYIKAWQPHLVSEWKEESDLSKLAWPLMDIAKILEEKEGPGNVQLLEVEEEVYQRMTTHNDNDAITLINSLRDGQRDGKPESHPECTAEELNHYRSQSHRIVLLGKNQRSQSKKSLNAEIISHKISSNTNESPSLLQSTPAPPVKPESLLKNILTPQWDSTEMLSEPPMLSGNSSFLDSYTGNKPLIGLFRVVECRSEDGITYCYLCHCCRIRSNKKAILDHLSSSSHLINYLVETHPEQVEVITAAVYDNSPVLQSLAKKVEQEEGRGELEVIHAPESLCILLTGKSYHWCIKMLFNGWTDINRRQKKETIKGPGVNTTSIEGMREKYEVDPSKCAQRMITKRKKRKVNNTVFKISFPQQSLRQRIWIWTGTLNHLQLTGLNTLQCVQPQNLRKSSLVKMQGLVNTWDQKEASKSLNMKRWTVISASPMTQLRQKNKSFMQKEITTDTIVPKKDQVTTSRKT
ncbi:uncharacterized protein [Channa argus]|uniref:uncharacterized protein isoform X2 n=1 Tax=Channa argus TaxID=215402 RepID=UPI003520E7B6